MRSHTGYGEGFGERSQGSLESDILSLFSHHHWSANGRTRRAKPCFCLGSRSLGCAGLKGELHLHIAELRDSTLSS